jgi:hypothetical protein
MQKRLLCIAPDDLAPAVFECCAMRDWEIRCVSDLGDAARALHADPFPVGLLMRVRGLQR